MLLLTCYFIFSFLVEEIIPRPHHHRTIHHRLRPHHRNRPTLTNRHPRHLRIRPLPVARSPTYRIYLVSIILVS